MNFFLTVSNGLLEKEHLKNMGSSIWLFMWFLDKMTSIDEEQVGTVLHGKPITYEDVFSDLGVSRATYTRWIEILRSTGYITTTRTPKGITVKVHKAKKIFGSRVNKAVDKSKSDVSKMNSDVSKMRDRCVNNDTSNIRQYNYNTYTKENNNKENSKTVDSLDHRGQPSANKEKIREALKLGDFKKLTKVGG